MCCAVVDLRAVDAAMIIAESGPERGRNKIMENII
jgi:hypothetical protein